MNEWLDIIRQRDERIDALRLEVDKQKAMLKAISQGQDPIKVLVEGMVMTGELHQQIANLKADAMQRIEAEQKRIDGYDASYAQLQSVMDVRDTLLQHVYDLLDRPDGILLQDMPAAIQAHKAKHDKSNIVYDTDDSYGEHL